MKISFNSIHSFFVQLTFYLLHYSSINVGFKEKTNDRKMRIFDFSSKYLLFSFQKDDVPMNKNNNNNNLNKIKKIKTASFDFLLIRIHDFPILTLIIY